MTTEESIGRTKGLLEYVAHLFKKNYRKREKVARFTCPHPDYSKAWVELPKEWLGKHAMLREQIINSSKEYGSEEITALAVAIALTEDFGGIPGIEGRDASKWKLGEVPIPVMSWLVQEVTQDFLSAYVVTPDFLSNAGAG